ncbi:MAG TPA: SWIM zinc finger family protein, partial [Candidatus Lustribacter sp.]|nr:SWIM zinc finger family protein [Candidatus Lustribacter sp.]
MTSTTDWVHHVRDKDVERRVGSSTFSRGRWYALQGRVRSLTHSPSGAILASVRGTRPAPYEVVVTGRRDHTGVWWDGECTCPVGYECKHAVAALLAARLALRPVQAPWEAVLEPLVREPEQAGPGSSTVPLALHFLVEAPRPGRFSSGVQVPRVTLRPMLRGKSGKWVKTGASWADLGSGYTRGPSQAQLGVIQALWQVATTGRGGYLQYSRPDRLDLASLPPAVWRVLGSAAEAGLALLSGLGQDTPVELAADPATFTIDVVADEDGSGGARVVPSVSVAGVRRRGIEVGWLGDPVHGFFLQSPPAGGPGGHAGSARTGGSLTLTRLAEPLDRDVSTLVLRSVEVAIPGADVGRFISLYYPRMRRRVAVESSDASVVLPQVVPPRLALDVTFSGGHVADLAWSFLYGDAEAAARLPLWPEPSGVSLGSRPAARDDRAERQIVDGLDCLDELPVLATVHGGRRRMAEQARLAGHDTRVFVTGVLPRLQADERVVVTVAG